MALKISQNYMTNNDCYKTGRKIKPIGVMVHSDACKAGIKARGWYSRWNKPGIEACVHAFIDDEEVIEYLPTEVGNCHRAWHGGGSSNNTHIAFEMCEPKDYNDTEYFNKVYKNAVEYTAHLLKKHGITNVTKNTVPCHYEGYLLGIATDHSDVFHWWKYQNKTMDDFRNDVKALLNGGNISVSTSTNTNSGNASLDDPEIKRYTEHGTCKVVTDSGLNIRTAPSTSSSKVGMYNKGETVVYDLVVLTEKYVWISWIGASSGQRRYMAVKDRRTGTRWGNCW